MDPTGGLELEVRLDGLVEEDASRDAGFKAAETGLGSRAVDALVTLRPNKELRPCNSIFTTQTNLEALVGLAAGRKRSSPALYDAKLV